MRKSKKQLKLEELSKVLAEVIINSIPDYKPLYRSLRPMDEDLKVGQLPLYKKEIKQCQ